MASLSDVTASITSVVSSLSALDLKLDEVKAKIDALSVGTVVSQAQLDELAALLDGAKTQASAVSDEASALVEPPPVTP